MSFDTSRHLRQLNDLIICQLGSIDQEIGNRPPDVGTVASTDIIGVADQHLGLSRHLATNDLTLGLRNNVTIGSDFATNDSFTQTIGRVNLDMIRIAICGVPCEHHACLGTLNHGLHNCGQPDRFMVVTLLHTVKDCPSLVERSPAGLNSLDHCIGAMNIQERCLLTGKRSVRQIFGRSR